MHKKAFPFLILFVLIPILVLSQIRVDNNGVSTFEHGTLVNEDTQTTTTKAINNQEFTIVLLAAIQEQNERIEALEKALKAKK